MVCELVPDVDESITINIHIIGIYRRKSIKILDEGKVDKNEILRICSFCKKIFDKQTGEWLPPDKYVEKFQLFNVTIFPSFSHTFCPVCFDEIKKIHVK